VSNIWTARDCRTHKKGIGLVNLRRLAASCLVYPNTEQLQEVEEGIYTLREPGPEYPAVKVMLVSEVSVFILKVVRRRIHHLILSLR